jgi:hypothetical protein
MGFAIFPTRGGGGRILVDAAQVMALSEDESTDGTGRARIYLPGVAYPIALREDANTVFARLTLARDNPGTYG